MNTRKHTIRSAFLIFLCMMLMMSITACGEKTIKEYPNLMNERIGLNKGALSYELNVPSIKKINEGVYSQRSLDSYLDGDLQILNDDSFFWQLVNHNEYPNVALELNIADVQGVNVKESADKEFINSVEQGYATGLKDVGKYIGNNVEGYLYQYKEGGFLDKCNSYGAYLVKKIDGGYLVIKVMTSDVNNTAMIDYVLSYFQDELGELKFEKV